MEPRVSDLLRAEHREVENQLDVLLYALKHLSPERVGHISESVEAIRGLVGVHMDTEERVFYPAIRVLVEDVLPRMLKQHDEIREAERCLGELLSGFPERPTERDLGELYRLGIEFHDGIQVHIVDEEEQLLKLVDERLPRERQEQLLAAMQGGGTAMQQKSTGLGLPSAEVVKGTDLVQYQEGSIVSRELLKRNTGNVTLFAIDAGQGLSEHTSPFDALVHILEGEGEIMVSGKPLRAKAGDLVLMPAHQPHALKAVTPFKMLLTMIRA